MAGSYQPAKLSKVDFATAMSTVTKNRSVPHPWARVQKPYAWRNWARANPQERDKVEREFESRTGIKPFTQRLRRSTHHPAMASEGK